MRRRESAGSRRPRDSAGRMPQHPSPVRLTRLSRPPDRRPSDANRWHSVRMRKWIVPFGSLLVFNVVVLLVIGWLTPAHVGWAAHLGRRRPDRSSPCGSSPPSTAGSRTMAAKSARATHQARREARPGLPRLRRRAGRLGRHRAALRASPSATGSGAGSCRRCSSSSAGRSTTRIDDRVARPRRRSLRQGDRRTGGERDGCRAPAAIPSPQTAAAQRELQDGLTEEQRRMLDELG